MPREYWETRMRDYREAHEFATTAMEHAQEQGHDIRRWNWEQERKRLVACYLECKRKISGA